MEMLTPAPTTSAPVSLANSLKAAASDKVFNAVCHVFALRKRSRRQVTVNALQDTMKEEGFDFSRDQIRDVLVTLAKLGVGTLDYGTRGSLRSLKDIQVTLQSIGHAAVGKNERLKSSRKPKLRKVPQVPQTFVDAPTLKRPLPLKPKVVSSDTLTVSIKVDGQEYVIELPVKKG